MLPIHKIIWHEWRARHETPVRIPEPSEAMEDPEQIRAYVKAYEWGGPTSALQLYHLSQLSKLIRPGDTVLDLACGPGPLLLELAPLYPECRFIGVDLSQPMLDALTEQSHSRGLKNVVTLREDVRTLPSLRDGEVDVVITTSALHHLPDIDALRQTLQRVDHLLAASGGLYMFDFGLLRSERTRAMMVAEVARLAPAITAQDYANSLRAAFVIDEVVRLCRSSLSRELEVRTSAFVDFFYFIRSASDRSPGSSRVDAYVDSIKRSLPMAARFEHAMLRLLQANRKSGTAHVPA